MKYLSTILFIFVLGLTALAQDTTGQIDILEDVNEDFDNRKKEQVQQEQYQDGGSLADKVLNREMEYAIESLDHRKEVFNWQLTAGKIIFVFVMLIVLSGLVLSYMHFYKSLKAPAGEAEKTELEMSTSGIKMNSSVIGLIILVLAIAFLYLYLIHVFPINEFTIDTKAVPGINGE